MVTFSVPLPQLKRLAHGRSETLVPRDERASKRAREQEESV